MRIVQIIDSLETGGAEKMAVNYANALADRIEFSGLITTRKEGMLKSHLNKNVSYLFLKRNSGIDLKAVFKLRSYLQRNKIQIIHAHSSSFFIAVLAKFTRPKTKIIWHDHYGISQDLKVRKNIILKFVSLLFSGTISVNLSLQKWAESYLKCKKIVYLPNFVELSTPASAPSLLKGENNKRIICVANLRPQKNHELLIEGASHIHKKFPDWTFHLMGKDFNDHYSAKLVSKVKELNLDGTIFFYGALENTHDLLKQCQIGVLTSVSEGLPLAVLEYGLAGLPVVATNVGEISGIIYSNKAGILIESNNLDQFVNSVQKLIQETDTRKEMGDHLKSFVENNFGKDLILSNYLSWLNL
ncbi:glycosyltransferase [Flavobacterium sp. DG2-3]|uniref:glycosyltransferase n=1 Tax=Flavobacterium sp. DG2-3 TaxID=3068317 RepID=UPI00273FE8D7|nr:glycosyltransferase [Flavobacterium sp. DG2-3]MDP5200665.1 glycosyltransferase [Flavobacterium sp. DG2-3]